MTPSTSKKRRTFEPLIDLTVSARDPSASEYIASRPSDRGKQEERRVIEHLAATFAGTPKPAPLWPKIGLRKARVDLDAIPWSRLSPVQLREIAERQYAGAAVGPTRASDLVSRAPGEPLRKRPVRRPAGHGAARRRVFALRRILQTAHEAGRLNADAYVERYRALTGL